MEFICGGFNVSTNFVAPDSYVSASCGKNASFPYIDVELKYMNSELDMLEAINTIDLKRDGFVLKKRRYTNCYKK